MATLAIRGHATRGKEVIELLKMLGGSGFSEGQLISCAYFINNSGTINIINVNGLSNNYVTFTLEEFLEKFPYKIGDKVIVKERDKVVTITDMDWRNGREVIYETLFKDDCYECFSAEDLQPYKEPIDKKKFPYEIGTRVSVKSKDIKKLATIVGISYNPSACMQYEIKFDGEDVVIHYPTDLMVPVQESPGEQTYLNPKANKEIEEIKENLKKAKEIIEEAIKIDIPKGYEFAGVDDDNQQVVFEKIGRQYPKTYEECHELMVQWKEYDCNPNSELILCESPIHDFCKIIVARNIYWKIAGEQMGLDKPWEPDWTDTTIKYCIERDFDVIEKNVSNHRGYVLAFPTEEMRDAFYENFKELIEQCKELL